ncbi:dehydrodolichyl diphosphate synthase complex subunit nus1 isoform X2 [Agrilus planipennis]|uniref:ditrans,polycis-polyprenyl diphosphate synthase [(2E,6E)-farnesyldiphosphate specific] n=1 Tax=Agrilus planipennis TaxID=224129 RepID=A0A1W4XB73_AGRPL|nr:dehydrodolichyl diphosphate synthase complex subunit nus1 isoform X2 [Agrilus planipennis]
MIKNPFQPVLRLKKIPNHLTVILGDEALSFQELANVVIWSLFTGINFISFFDHKGDFKQKEDSFREVVSKMMKDRDHVVWYDSKVSAYKNGFVGRKIHVKILTPNDGKPLIARAAEELVDLKKDISIELVDDFVKKHFEFPDPDLAIYCSRKCTTWGYPPWQLRLTEFINLERHTPFTQDIFIKLLYRYSKCEQRLGK